MRQREKETGRPAASFVIELATGTIVIAVIAVLCAALDPQRPAAKQAPLYRHSSLSR